MTIVHVLTILCLIVLPLLTMSGKKKSKSAERKIDTDTSNAHYAVNANGFLEEVKGDSKISSQYID